jgi:hypothetical protein
MSKRGRSDGSLTGGTRDVNPQWLNIGVLTLSAANTFTEAPISLPVPRYSASGGKSIVMEFLKVEFNNPALDTEFGAASSNKNCVQALSTISQTAVASSSPRTIQWCEVEFRGAFTAAGTYETKTRDPLVFDLTDGAGHGLLIGTDQIFWGANTLGYTAAALFGCRILYRFKEIALTEYIGIVQSQQ